MKKFLSTLLVISLLIVSVTTIKTYAATNDYPDYARLTIFAYYDPDAEDPNSSSSSITNTGHAFIAIENFSGRRINAGKMALNDLEAATIGTWSLESSGSIPGHTGVWYNLEMDYLFRNDTNHFHSVSMEINQTQLSALNSFIQSRDSWSLINNCSTFARDAWNLLNPDNELSTGFPSTPTRLIEAMQELSGYETTFRPIFKSNKKGFYNENGSFVSAPWNVWLNTPYQLETE